MDTTETSSKVTFFSIYAINFIASYSPKYTMFYIQALQMIIH